MAKPIVSKGTHLTEQDYKTAKALVDAGVSNSDVAKITRRSASTIGYIQRSTSFDNYKELVNIKHQKSLAKKQTDKTKTEPKQQPVVITEQSELTRIANALERLVDAWEAQPRRLFGKK